MEPDFVVKRVVAAPEALVGADKPLAAIFGFEFLSEIRNFRLRSSFRAGLKCRKVHAKEEADMRPARFAPTLNGAPIFLDGATRADFAGHDANVDVVVGCLSVDDLLRFGTYLADDIGSPIERLEAKIGPSALMVIDRLDRS
jgi:hypothetical protein